MDETIDSILSHRGLEPQLLVEKLNMKNGRKGDNQLDEVLATQLQLSLFKQAQARQADLDRRSICEFSEDSDEAGPFCDSSGCKYVEDKPKGKPAPRGKMRFQLRKRKEELETQFSGCCMDAAEIFGV